MERLKKKWGIETNFQFWVIMVVFSLAGTSVVRVKPYIFSWLGVGANAALWLKILLWPVIVLPSYYLLFMMWGTLLGQRRFAWWFTSKTLRRLKILPPEKTEDVKT